MDEIAISGVSGRFPKCDSVDEFKVALLAGRDLITDNHKRWPYKFLRTPPSLGVLDCWEHFDASFFSMNQKQVDEMDPRTRQILEVCYECILDAGINPVELRGSKTGVFLAATENFSNKGVMNRMTAVMANTISYVLDLKASSYAVDTGCSTSIYIMNQAIDLIKLGECDAAIVCSAQNHLHPEDSIVMTKMGILSHDGRCKTFDNERNGYVKSEAVVAIFLQKQTDARRIYATVAGIGCNVDGYKAGGMFSPSCESQVNLLEEVYNKYGIDVKDMSYIETHGTGTVMGDIKECESIVKVFNLNTSTTALKIGSVKTITGHTESAAGLVSLVKLLVTIQTGVIPRNIHYHKPANDIPGIYEGKLEVVNKNTFYDGKLLATSAFGIGGANGHLVIKPFYTSSIHKTNNQPRLVLVSGRTTNAVDTLLATITELHKNNHEFLSIIARVFEKPLYNHSCRGYTILNRNIQEINRYSGERRPIWFSFSGMGSQWPKMGRDLMDIDIFKNSIKRCSMALQPYEMDLEDIVVNGTEETLADPQYCFPAIIAVSVGLTDILYSLGIKPDGIIGHSLGEIGCAYADGVITAEQAVLVAYARGFATDSTKLISGLMASVGLGFHECVNILPNDIFIACINSDTNVTISGPEASIRKFVEELDGQHIFAKIVNTANIAFHSRYIHSVGPLLLTMLKNIIPAPQRRSEKWLPSAVPEHEYGSDLGMYNSAEYHHHNFMNTVLFNQVLKKVPKNAVLVEVAPRGLFQAIFKRSLNQNIPRVVLLNRDEDDNFAFFLSNVGRIYVSGDHKVVLRGLYPEPKFPVDSRVPNLSSLIQWDHSTKWYVPYYKYNIYEGQKILFDLKDPKNQYLLDFSINGSNIFPHMGFIFLAWKALANITMLPEDELSVRLEDIKFLKTVVIQEIDHLEFFVNMLRTGRFEIWHKQCIVCTGKIFSLKDVYKKCCFEESSANSKQINLSNKEFYEELHLRGCDASGIYKSVINCDISGNIANIQWNNNWIVLLENIFQAFAVGQHRELVTPSEISEIIITPNSVFDVQNQRLKYTYHGVKKEAYCGGIKIDEIKVTKLNQLHKIKEPTLFKYTFVKNCEEYTNNKDNHLEYSLRIALNIVLENNLQSLVTNVAEYIPNYVSRKLTIDDQYYQAIVKVVSEKHLNLIRYTKIGNLAQVKSNTNLVLLSHIEETSHLNSVISKLSNTTFLFSKVENKNISKSLQTFIRNHLVFQCFDENSTYMLLKKVSELPEDYTIIEASNMDFSWIDTLQNSLFKSDDIIYLVNKEADLGILGLFTCLKEELCARNLRIFILEPGEKFELNLELYNKQVRLDLSVNVLSGKTWGTYRILPLSYVYKKNNNWVLRPNGNEVEIIEQNPFKIKPVEVLYVSPFKWNDLENMYVGFEFCGIDDNGEKIIGICPKGNIKSHCEKHNQLIWQLPTDTNEESALSLLVTYTLGYYSLFIKVYTQRHHKIIVFGTSDVCLASVALALNKGCEVLVVTLDKEEVVHVLENNPKLREESVFNCQDHDFATRILDTLNHKNVDIILYESEDLFCKSRFLNLSSGNFKAIDISLLNRKLSANVVNDLFAKKCQVICVRLKDLFGEDYNTLENIRLSIQTCLNRKVISPLTYQTVNIVDLEAIIKHTQETDAELNKLVIKVKGFENSMYEKVRPCVYFDEARSYLLTESLCGFYLELGKFLVGRGAKNIFLNSYSGSASGYQDYCLDTWKRQGVNVFKTSFNTIKLDECQKLVALIESIKPLGGIFQLASTTENKLFSDMNVDDFAKVAASKISSAQNLDTASRNCKNLKYFVLFLSAASLGYSGQSNDAYVGSALKNICLRREKDNVPALAIHCGFKTDETYSTYFMDKLLLMNETVSLNADVFKEQAANIEEKESDIFKTIIINILGVKNWDQMDENTTLQNLGVDSISYIGIKHALKEKLGVNLETTEIFKLTIRDLEGFDKDRKLDLVNK